MVVVRWAPDRFRDCARRIVEIAENHGAAGARRARFDAGRHAARVDTVNAQRARFGSSGASWHLGPLVLERLVHKGTRLVGAGHHAIAAPDADVPVDQDDAVGSFERGSGRADVDTGRHGAVLAHDRHFAADIGLGIAHAHLADPLRFVRVNLVQAVFVGAGRNAHVAAGRALVEVDKQAPAHLGIGWPAGQLRNGRRRGHVEDDTGREHRHANAGGTLQEGASARAAHPLVFAASFRGHRRLSRRYSRSVSVVSSGGTREAPCAFPPSPGRDAWHSKQSIETAA